MFGTVAKMKVKPGMEAQFREIFEEWHRVDMERGVEEVAGLLYKLENSPDEYIMVAAFTNRESYFANADDSTTDRYYQRFRETLVEDPEWNDGEIVMAEGVGGI